MGNEIMHYDSFVNWDSGEPVVEYRKMLTKENVAKLPLLAVSMPYKRSEEDIMMGLNKEFEGLSNAEVIAIKLARRAANGSMEHIKLLYDRILGKPKQQIETYKVSENYHEFVDRITEEENEIREASANVI